MLLELLIAGHLQTYNPKPEPEVKETETVQVIEEAPPAAPVEPTLEEKIATNYYKCDTTTHYIRADNAQCLAKPVKHTSVAAKARTGAPRASQGAGNTYSYGYCTWYVKNKLAWVPNGLGHASSWINGLSRTTARPGVVAWEPGHVAVVISVTETTVTVSEMNFKGWNIVSSRTKPISHFVYLN